MNTLKACASLIIAAKSNFNASKLSDYRLLCLKRSSSLKFMPNSYVFPGGSLCEFDSSLEWLKLFEKSGYDINSLKTLCPKKNIPHILRETNNELPKYLSLRICAIRETFEECGILLCRSKHMHYDGPNWASYYMGNDILKWQHKILDEPSEFLNLCTQLGVYPDVFAMADWTNWVTPQSFQKRFDTIFFLTTIDQMPDTCVDDKEISLAEWRTPQDFVNDCSNGRIFLPPPQFYEISRLKEFPSINGLSEFAAKRSSEGYETYCPFKVETDEGIFTIFPGDELYPTDMNISDAKVVKIVPLPETHSKNRLFVGKNRTKLFVENIIPGVKHVPPKSS